MAAAIVQSRGSIQRRSYLEPHPGLLSNHAAKEADIEFAGGGGSLPHFDLNACGAKPRKALVPDCMAEVVKRIPAEDLIAVSSWLARQPLPADTHPAAKAPQGKPLPEALRCGSAPELQGGKP